MNVSLTPELEKLINEKVESGLFNSASEVIRAGLRLLIEQDELKQIRFETLKADLRAGLDQEAKGDIVSGEETFKKLRNKRKTT
ncbi:MAG: type II toxin-antitoxin system ParD family antitoxin [Candidatus Obscuribacter sp.]|jgi:antitoxin ParD1/3/4|nr:type II toxin-antitoxin system ParD family antitoxin [Candidatus Obscuribacter sp.]MDQ5968435.1 antitoxin ParD1/3/4 [Cyanobacteriota bacterium erpe_2018_sw_39hr_WHONDRS-SW48-000098_B_bin.30]MBK7841775.1 type II toxin-antitoxin system ParD family antitoxin [Candidatus Obscuribacter sp.]MBK9204505.1 type II toxin-antitoxin system ParD family antitoxin [Candidatus Obscuribacter sp.]MBK9622365.1 type II toxin-antitoxin system ParD family antitoxin [Candidatus Obscuribacter sp.]